MFSPGRTRPSPARCRLGLSVALVLFGSLGCAHSPGYRLADRAERWQRLEESGCRVGTIEGAGAYESRCYICPDGGKVCV